MCDRLAAAGYLVVGPDVFRGQPWSLDKFPPKPEDDIQGWIKGWDWASKVKPDVDAVVAALTARGMTRFASVGWCWGASMAARIAADNAGSFRATAFLHPSLFGHEQELCAALRCPLATFSTPGGACAGGFGCVVPLPCRGLPDPCRLSHTASAAADVAAVLPQTPTRPSRRQ